MLVYASLDDLVGWSSAEIPDGIDVCARLRSASILVRRETRAARYDTDSAGKPSDPDVSQAFTDATCAQAAAWIAAGIDPTSSGAVHDQQVASKSMGGRSISLTTAPAEVLAKRFALATQLCDEARDILANAGLLEGQPAWL